MSDTDAIERKPALSMGDVKKYAVWFSGLVLTGGVGFAHGRLSAVETLAAGTATDVAVIKATESASEHRQDRLEALLQEILKELRRHP